MPGICDGRVVIVTGAGRGLGREHALEFARQGARVVVNDVGAELDGTGGSSGPAGEVVDQIRALGGEAIANGDDISIAEPWHAGAQADQGSRWDPAELGPVVHDLVAKARPKVGLFGQTEQAPAPVAELR